MLANYQQPNFEMISELTIKMQTSLLSFLSTIEYKISQKRDQFLQKCVTTSHII